MLRCLLIDDDDDLRQFLVPALQQAGYRCSACAHGAAAGGQWQGGEWDVVILDRMLPGVADGLDLLQAARAGGDTTPVLILSAIGGVDQRVQGLRGGGDDYLEKPFALPELLARLENLVRRQRTLNESLQFQVADLRLDLLAKTALRAGRDLGLQPREFQLLHYLMRHEGQVVTRTMLLEAVWSYHFDPQTNVIDVQISRLRGKVDRGFDLPLIHTVRGAGYVFSASWGQDDAPA